MTNMKCSRCGTEFKVVQSEFEGAAYPAPSHFAPTGQRGQTGECPGSFRPMELVDASVKDTPPKENTARTVEVIPPKTFTNDAPTLHDFETE